MKNAMKISEMGMNQRSKKVVKAISTIWSSLKSFLGSNAMKISEMVMNKISSKFLKQLIQFGVV